MLYRINISICNMLKAECGAVGPGEQPFALAGKPDCESQGYFHYWPHLSVRSLISTSIFYSAAVMAACLRDRTAKKRQTE